jgi:hypothetical protein
MIEVTPKLDGALKHDDMVDVLALGVGHWVDYLNADALKAEQERKARFDAEFERKLYASAVFGGHLKKPSSTMARRGRGRPRRR